MYECVRVYVRSVYGKRTRCEDIFRVQPSARVPVPLRAVVV